MADPRPLCFGDCVVDVPARTVLRGGQPQVFEPKVFDALVYLIEHRGRVVPKQELLESVWSKRVVVTEGVIARTIMKVRRLLGDDADQPALVKTVHRIGYRFMGEVTRGAASVAGSDARDATPVRTRVAVLPFVNRTGSDALAWVDLGLMTATSQALQAGGVEVVAAAELLPMVRDSNAPLAAATSLASDVVQATLGKRNGALTLAWVGHGRTLERSSGDIEGSDPIEMCRRLASALLSRLGPGSRDAAANAALDPYLQAVRTRAAAAIAGERWESARRLLQVAADAAPDDTPVQLDLARCLVQLRDARALPLLERLQRCATTNGDSALERRCLRLLARCKRSDPAEAERLLSRALALAEAQRDGAAELELLQAMAELSGERGRAAIADWQLDRAVALAQSLGDRGAIAHTLDTRGRLAAAAGERETAIRHFDDALQMQHAAGIHAGAAHTLTHLGDMHHAFGRICTARQCFAAAFDKALKSGDPAAIAIAGLNVGRYAGVATGRDDFAAGIVERMRAVDSPGRVVIDTFADVLDGLVQARAGRLADCLELLDRAEAGYARRNFRLRVIRYRARVLAASGFVEEARDTMREFLDDVPSGLRSLIASLAQHMLAVCDHAAGDATAALRHLDAAISRAPHSLHRLNMVFDAAWLRLDHGDDAGAAQTLRECRAEFDAALADDHGPALLLRAMQHEVAGETEAAGSLRKRCPLPPQAGFVWQTLPHAARFLPSMLDVAPGLIGQRQRLQRAA